MRHEKSVDQRRDEFDVLCTTRESQAAVMVLPPGEKTGGPDNKHERSDQWMVVLAGDGEALVEGRPLALHRGDVLLIEAGEAHEVRCAGDEPLVTVNVYSSPEY